MLLVSVLSLLRTEVKGFTIREAGSGLLRKFTPGDVSLLNELKIDGLVSSLSLERGLFPVSVRLPKIDGLVLLTSEEFVLTLVSANVNVFLTESADVNGALIVNLLPSLVLLLTKLNEGTLLGVVTEADFSLASRFS